jgi:hypothetical protein
VAVATAALAAGGCLRAVPRTQTTQLGRTIAPSVVDSVGPLELRTRVTATTVIVTAQWPRRCRRDVNETVEAAEWDAVVVAGTTDGDRWGYVVGAGLVVVWPVGLAVAGVSLVALVAQQPRSRTTRRTATRVAVRRRSCPVRAALLAVQLTLPSGRAIDGVTDETGTAMFLLPAGEEGMVMASAAADALAPDDPALRRAPAGASPPADVRLSSLVRTAESRAWARDCATVRIIGGQVRAIDERYFARAFRGNALIARCAPLR